MSTYTDLHNRVKENIAVDYNNRITTQRVRLFNEQNEFWGTLRGHISAENININGGILSGVTIQDAVLTGNVILPGNYDLAKIGSNIYQLSVDLEELDRRLYSEEDTRQIEDIKLSTRIDGLKADLAREIGTLSIVLTQQDSIISSYLSSKIEQLSDEMHDLSAEIYTHLDYLSDEIDTTNLNLGAETKDRIIEDNKLLCTITNVNLSSIERDDMLSAALSMHIQDNIEEFQYADAKMLSTVEHDRHYIINKDGTTASYPYKAKDYAVNVFRASVPDARVTYTNIGGQTSEVGTIKLDSDTSDKLPFTFKAYTNIEEPAIASALIGNKAYAFTDAHPSIATEANGYNLNYYIPSIVDAQLSDAKLILVPTLPEFHKVYLSGTTQMIGKVGNAKPTGASSNLTSMELFIDTEDQALLTFNKFKYIHFDNGDDKSTKRETERITYNGNNQFTLQKNIDSAKYIQCTDVLDDEHAEFARIYDEKNGISGIISNDVDGITGINIYVNLPFNSIAYLNTANNFKTVIQTTPEFDTIVSAVVDNTSADIDIVRKAEMYQYAFTRADEVGEIVEQGVVIPNVYNKTLNDSPEYNTVSVDATSITNIGAFAKVWVLTKAEDNLWTVEDTDENGNSINIKYNEAYLFVKITKASGEVTRRRYEIKFNEPTIVNVDTCHQKLYCSGLIDLEQPRIDAELPEVTYYAVVEDAVSFDASIEYDLDIDTSNNDSVKIQIPDKTTDDISREFFITIKLDSKIKKTVKAEFVFSDGTPAEIFNNKHKDLYITASSDPTDWVTYMVNEVKPNKFLITDLNDYEDHQILEQLRANITWLSGQHDWLSAELSTELSNINAALYEIPDFLGNKGLSGKIDFLLSTDKSNVNYKGTLPYLSNYTDPTGFIQHYAMLSTFIMQNPSFVVDDHLKLGDMFKLSAVQSCLYDCAATSVYLGENDYFVINKDCRASEILVSDLDIFRNAQAETAALSNELVAQIYETSVLLSSDISTKIWIKDPATDEFKDGKYSDLSVVKLQLNEYVDKVKNGKVDANILYIISSDYVDTYGQVISNMVMTDDLTPSEAASQHYVDTLSTALSNDIDTLSTALSTDLSAFEVNHYFKTLSGDVELRYPTDPHVTTIVDQLLIKDEITFDLYRLTIRNGALNINLVKKFELI